MYSASDFEKLWFLYKTEGEPNGISINSFCVTHGVSYTHFNDWFRKTHKKIVPVQIDGKPSEECEVSEPVKEDIKKTIHTKGNIMVSIQMCEGLQIRKKNLSYRVIAELRKRLDYHLYFDKEPKGDLMQKALNYLHSFWESLFRYRRDGNYTIDNSLAERSIRPLTVERKNSLFFCSTAGAKASAIFHTIIETCRLLGLSARQYICDFLQAVASGRTDWQNLTPAKLYL